MKYININEATVTAVKRNGGKVKALKLLRLKYEACVINTWTHYRNAAIVSTLTHIGA